MITVRTRLAPLLGGLIVALVATGCGTSAELVDLEDPTTTTAAPAADDEDPAPAEAAAALSTTTTTTVPPVVVPTPRADTPGVVIVDGVALPVDRADGAGWEATDPCGVVVQAVAPPPRQAVVALDPAGDSGADPAAVATNAAIAAVASERLAATGVEVMLTRTADADVAASYRGSAVEASGARILVSISVSPAGAGDAEIVHRVADTESRRLATLLHEEIGDDGTEVRAVLNQRGSDWFTVLRDLTDVAAVVLHLPVAAPGTVDDERVRALGTAVAVAVFRSLTTDDAGSALSTMQDVVRDASTASPGSGCGAVDDAN